MSTAWKWPAVALLASIGIAAAQELPQIVVPLKINEQEATFVQYLISFRDVWTGPRSGFANGRVSIRVEPTDGTDHSYRVWVQGREPVELKPDSSMVVRIERTWPGRQPRVLPYEIGYQRAKDAKGGIQETFYWRSHYRAEGQLELAGCKALIVVLDQNADGVFTAQASGTSLGLDRNGDRNISGRDEWLATQQPIEFCDRVLQVDEIAPDGSSISFSETTLRIPKVGDPFPDLSLKDTTGRTIDTAEWKGKVVVLDFWASWCRPCIAKFAPLQKIGREFADDLVVVSINVDAAEDLDKARSLMAEHQIPWRTVMNGLGNADPVWRTLGSIGDHRMGLSFYVLVDQNGIIRYTTVGANDLSDLRAKIGELVVTRKD